jgi:endonuclease-3
MQLSLCLDTENVLPSVYTRLKLAFGSFREGPRASALDELIRAMAAAKAQEDVARAAFLRLKNRFHPWDRLLAADPAEVAAILAPAPHAEAKAAWICETLSRLQADDGSVGLEVLAGMDVEAALAWLRRLPGVGERTATTVLNFSVLRRPVMVVEGHVWRVARRIGLAGKNLDPAGVRRAVMQDAPADWTGDDFFDLHWLLKRLGQTFCGETRARCGACPVAGQCQERRRLSASGRTGNVLALRREGS